MADHLVAEVADVVPRSADAVWAVLSDFGDVIRLFSNVTHTRLEGEGIGMTRTLTLDDGSATVSRLTELDHDRRTLGYAIIETALPLHDYRSQVTVEPVDEGRCLVRWSSRCRPSAGHEDSVRALLDGQLRHGIAALGSI